MSRYYYGFPPYVSVAQKRAKAEKKLKALRKKNPGIAPVVIEGRSIASTWWGKSWNQNLERYADYSNRIGRGRSYVRHGAVLDLKIKAGEIRSLVQGSQGQPYKVVVSIKPLSKENWKKVREAAAGKLDSLGELLAGKFPKGLQELFFARGEGLFPEPKEIDFDCSCPDWASMCKHVAATLYGVGARLDQDPGLFFALRKIEMEDLITQAVKGTTRALLKKADSKSSRVMEGADLGDVFGIELEEEVGKEVAGKSRRKKSGRGENGCREEEKGRRPEKKRRGSARGNRPCEECGAEEGDPENRSAKEDGEGRGEGGEKSGSSPQSAGKGRGLSWRGCLCAREFYRPGGRGGAQASEGEHCRYLHQGRFERAAGAECRGSSGRFGKARKEGERDLHQALIWHGWRSGGRWCAFQLYCCMHTAVQLKSRRRAAWGDLWEIDGPLPIFYFYGKKTST